MIITIQTQYDNRKRVNAIYTVEEINKDEYLINYANGQQDRIDIKEGF